MRTRWPYVAELARVERTLVQIFHAADAPALSAEAMRAIAPAKWPALALRRHPASAILDCQWRVDELRRDIDEGRGLNEPARAPGSVLIWRQNGLVHYRALERGERAALALAAQGASFAAMCEAVAAEADDDDAAALINRLLARWLADGLLSAA